MSDDLKDELEAEKPSDDTLIESWLKKHGEEKHTKAGVPYWKIESRDYQDALSALLNSMLYAGYIESDVRSEVLLKKIQKALTNEMTDSGKLASWKDIISKVWKFVVASHFADTSLIKPATNFAAEKAAKAKEKAEARAKMTAEQIAAEEAPPAPYVSPENVVDPHAVGYGDAECIYDDTLAKLFEKLKNE